MSGLWNERAGVGGMVAYQFGAAWCGPCKTLLPRMQAAAAETGVRLEVVDIDRDPEAALAARLAMVPTVILYRDGVEAGRSQGLAAAAWLREQAAGLATP